MLSFFLFSHCGGGDSTPVSSPDDISGYWIIHDTTTGTPEKVDQLEITMNGSQFTVADACSGRDVSTDGVIENGAVSFSLVDEDSGSTTTLHGSVNGTQIQGTYSSIDGNGAWLAEKTDHPACPGALSLQTSFGHGSLDLGGMRTTIAVSGAGYVFVNKYKIFYDTLDPIHVFDPEGRYLGDVTDSDDPVPAETFLIDDNDILHAYYTYGTFNHTLYQSDGTVMAAHETSDHIISLPSVDRDGEGNNYVIPTGTGTDADGWYQFVWKLSEDFATMHDSIDRPTLLAMLPGSPADDEVTLHDIRVFPNGDLVICADISGDGNDRDGLLVLNADLTKKTYIGGDWMFNDPWGVDYDADGYIYVSSTYHNRIEILDSAFQPVGSAGVEAIPTLESDDDFLPVDLCVKNEKLYVLNTVDSKVYVFGTFTADR